MLRSNPYSFSRHAHAVAQGSITPEAEGMVGIGLHHAAIYEQRAPFPAFHADVPPLAVASELLDDRGREW